jgi:hypothetical protein
VASPLESLQHQAAREAALALTSVVIGLLRPEEVHELQREYFAIIQASLRSYEERRARLN